MIQSVVRLGSERSSDRNTEQWGLRVRPFARWISLYQMWEIIPILNWETIGHPQILHVSILRSKKIRADWGAPWSPAKAPAFHPSPRQLISRPQQKKKKKKRPQTSRFYKYLQRDEIKKVLGYNKQEGKLHRIQSKQESERHRSRDSLVRQTDTLLNRHGLFTLMRSKNTRRNIKKNSTHLFHPGQLEKLTALQFLLSHSLSLRRTTAQNTF